MGQRPSELYGVKPKHVAYYFDRAVELFGRSLEDRVRTVSEGEKNQKSAEFKATRELKKWLSSADQASVKQQRQSQGVFRDPMRG